MSQILITLSAPPVAIKWPWLLNLMQVVSLEWACYLRSTLFGIESYPHSNSKGSSSFEYKLLLVSIVFPILDKPSTEFYWFGRLIILLVKMAVSIFVFSSSSSYSTCFDLRTFLSNLIWSHTSSQVRLNRLH